MWFRLAPIKTLSGKDQIETWISKRPSVKRGKKYELRVRSEKPIDILSLKRDVLDDFSSKVSYFRRTRTLLFKKGKTEKVSKCPICGLSSKCSKFCLKIYGASYHQCPRCTHYFVINPPTKKVLEDFYRTDEDYPSTYTSKRTSKTRVDQVASHKAKWAVEQFKLEYKRKPRLILDVGAGGGHFVYAAKKLGLDVYGLELSRESRRFCQENFDIKLQDLNFLKDFKKLPQVDVITFWGLIEHVPKPMDFFKVAYKLLARRKTLMIAEVPRWDCLGTTVQTTFPDSVIRHLAPIGHIHCFTDTSLATAFEKSGFAPVAAWYFGMDAYELMTQLSFLLKKKEVIKVLGKHLSSLQSTINQARLSDEIVLAGKPLST